MDVSYLITAGCLSIYVDLLAIAMSTMSSACFPKLCQEEASDDTAVMLLCSRCLEEHYCQQYVIIDCLAACMRLGMLQL